MVGPVFWSLKSEREGYVSEDALKSIRGARMRGPDSFVILNGAFASDGGSIALHVRDSQGSEHSLLLQQHLLLHQENPSRLPGRLYYDNVLVPVRSEVESRILAALHEGDIESAAPEKNEDTEGRSNANPGMVVGDDIKEYMSKIDQGPNAALAHLVERLIEYVESSEYVELSRR